MKKTLFLFLIFAGVLVWGGYVDAQTPYEICIEQGGDYEDCKDREGAPPSGDSDNPCAGKGYGDFCTQSDGQPGICGGGDLCLPCGGAGDSCESICCSGFSCVSGKCVAGSGGTNPTGNTSGGTNPTGDTSTSSGVKCDSANFKEIAGVCFPKNTGLAETSISTILSNALFWLLGIFGFFGIAGFVISGIQYLVSAGDDKMIETAKRNMKWSLIGVVVGISGMVIIRAITAALEATTSSF